jgi:hypothetical protein
MKIKTASPLAKGRQESRIEKWDPETIQVLGVWGLRITLAIGAIVAGCLGKQELMSACMTGLVLTFIFL